MYDLNKIRYTIKFLRIMKYVTWTRNKCEASIRWLIPIMDIPSWPRTVDEDEFECILR